MVKKLKTIKKKNLKKIDLLGCFFLKLNLLNPKYLKNISYFFKYFKTLNSLNYLPNIKSYEPAKNLFKIFNVLTITQKTPNLKTTLTKNNVNLSTFTIGTLLKHFKVKQNKFLRRSVKGSKIFFNSLKNILQRKYKLGGTFFIIKISGFNYNLTFLKKSIVNIFINNIAGNFILLFNIKVSFTKQRGKGKKSIKKRLKKKMLLSFLKSNKINLV